MYVQYFNGNITQIDIILIKMSYVRALKSVKQNFHKTGKVTTQTLVLLKSKQKLDRSIYKTILRIKITPKCFNCKPVNIYAFLYHMKNTFL